MNGINNDTHLLMTKHDRTEHDLFGQLLRFGLHHQHRRLGTGHDQIQLRLGQLGNGRIEHVLAINVANTGGAHRAIEWNTCNTQRSRRANHRRDVRIDVRVDRQHMQNDLHFIEIPFREQRTNRAIDQARGQRLFFRRTAFALEKAARNTAGCISFFDVINGQWEKILTGLGVLACHNGGKNHGVFDRDHHGAGRLARDLAGFQGDSVLAILEGLRNFIKHRVVPLYFCRQIFRRCRSPHHGQRTCRRLTSQRINRWQCPRQKDEMPASAS